MVSSGTLVLRDQSPVSGATNAPRRGQDAAEPDDSDYFSRHRFFTDNSPWNTQIPQEAKYAPIAGIASYPVGLTSWLAHGGSIAIYFAHASDPLLPILENPRTEALVRRGVWRRVGNSKAVERQIQASSTALLPVEFRRQHGNRPARRYSSRNVLPHRSLQRRVDSRNAQPDPGLGRQGIG